MALTYIDPLTGRSRVKRRYLWATYGVVAGMLAGFSIHALFS
ncbi:MAG: hypothetical protein VX836_13550 [Pseudomonadota bacterium]|jgi:hypothetical protein|nr:hypothetical protein [Pseudomonadota bacterium]